MYTKIRSGRRAAQGQQTTGVKQLRFYSVCRQMVGPVKYIPKCTLLNVNQVFFFLDFKDTNCFKQVVKKVRNRPTYGEERVR